MKIILLAPKNPGGEVARFATRYLSFVFGENTYGTAPLALPVVAAQIPGKHEIRLIDENVDDIDFNEDCDLVGITANTWQVSRAYDIAKEYRERGIPVILGGIHPSLLPEEAIKHADSIVIGESEGLWDEIIKDCETKSLKKYYKLECRPCLSKLPIPRWDLLDPGKYRLFPIQVSRGCLYDCEFCSVKSMYGKEYRHKRIEKTINEVRIAKDLHNFIFFVDDNFIGNRKHIKELMKKLIPLKVRYLTQLTINVADDDELLGLLVESGCSTVIIGFESLSQNNLLTMNKHSSYKPEEYHSKIEKIQSVGIEIYGSFIFGYDSDDENVFERTVDFIAESNLASIILNCLTPYPGTRLYNRLEKEDRIIHKDWTKYDGNHVCIKPKKLSIETLHKGHIWAKQQVHSLDAILKRMNGLWRLWNKTNIRLNDRIMPLMAALDANNVAYQYPIISSIDEFKKNT